MMEAVDNAVDMVERYLLRLKLALADVPAEQREEFAREIRSHIIDRLEHEPGDSRAACRSILQTLGEPDAIAADYRAERLVARAARFRLKLPWAPLRTGVRWLVTAVEWFVIGIAAVIGYPTAAAFSLTAVLKPFFPHNIGLFISNDGFQLAAFPAPSGREMVGPYYTPLALLMACVLLVGTSQFVKWLRRRGTQLKKYLL